MKSKILGIELGGTTIKLVDLRKKGKGMYLNETVLVPTPPESILDGEIINGPSVKQALEQVIKDHKIKTDAVVVLLKSSYVVTREVTIKASQNKEIETLLKYNLAEYMPVEPNKYEWGYAVTGEVEKEDGMHKKLTLSAIPKNMVADIIALMAQLKLKTLGIYTQNDALSVAFHPTTGLIDKMAENCLIVDCGGRHVSLSVRMASGAMVHQDLSFGFDRLNEYLMDLFEDKSIEEIERIKRVSGAIYPNEEIAVTNDIEGARISANIRPVLDRQITQNLMRFMELHEKRQGGQYQPTQIYLIGGGARLKHLAQYINGQVNLPVEVVETLRQVTLNEKTVNPKDLTSVVGLCAAATQTGINLLPKEYLKTYGAKNYGAFILGALLIETLIVGYQAYQPIKLEKELNQQIQALGGEIGDSRFDETKRIHQALNEINKEQTAWQETIAQLKTHSIIEGKTLDTLLNHLPEGMTIHTMTLQDAEKQLTLKGQSMNQYTVMQYGAMLQSYYPEASVVYHIVPIQGTSASGSNNAQASKAQCNYTLSVQWPLENEMAVKQVQSENKEGGDI